MKYFPFHISQHSQQTTWRPWPLRVPFFAFFTTLCVLLFIGIELIIRGCRPGGCHVFSTISNTEISNPINFAYNLAPTVMSVGLGLLWAVPHHDIMRLEPYFQMSVNGGANAINSLLLEYPYTFAFLVPYEAGKRRHYVVLVSSCTLLLMNFFVTPLVAGMFDSTMLERLVPGEALRRGLKTGDLEAQTTSSFTYLAYTYNWLGSSLPSFTTPTFALAPVDAIGAVVNNEMWSAGTTLFEADLACESAIVSSDPNITTGIDISSRSGESITTLTFQDNVDSGLAGTALWTSATLFYAGAQGARPNSYMVALARGRYEITALTCNTSFYSRPVTATFESSSGAVTNVNFTGDQTPFLDVVGFTSAIYGQSQLGPQYLGENGALGLGFVPVEPPNIDSAMRQQLGPLAHGAQEIVNNLVSADSMSPVYFFGMEEVAGLAMHNRNLNTLEELMDPNVLASSYRDAFQLLFALWIATEVMDPDVANRVATTRRQQLRGFVVNELWARGAQGGLIAAAVMATVLCVLISRRSCELDGEPNSIGEGLRLLSESPDLSLEMEEAEFKKPEMIMQALSAYSKRYTLKLIPNKGPIIRVTKNNSGLCGVSEPSGVPERPVTMLADQLSPVLWSQKLWALRNITGIGFVLCIGIVLALLIAAFQYAPGHHGLPTFAPVNSLGYKSLFSFLPLAISKSIEALLITVGSCYCMLGSYKTLHRRDALKSGIASSRSLTVDYDKSLPHFQFLRSLRTGNIALAALNLSILMSYGLSIAFSALFSLIYAELHSHTKTTCWTPKINGTFSGNSLEMNYVLDANLGGIIHPLVWTTPEYYILPFYPSDGNVSRYEGSTLGIGVDIKCSIIMRENIKQSCPNYPGSGNQTVCTLPLYVVDIDDSLDVHNATDLVFTDGRLEVGCETYCPSGDVFLKSSNSSDTFFAIWFQQEAGTYLPLEHMDAAILKCTTQDKVVKLNATIDQDQRVISISAVHPLDPQEMAALYSSGANSSGSLSSTFVELMYNGVSLVADFAPATPALTWFNHFLVALNPSIVQNNTNITHIPNPLHLADTFEDVYRRLFAISVGLNAETLLVNSSQVSAPAIAYIPTVRVNVNGWMFTVSASILSFIMLVLVVTYWFQGPAVPGHMPTTLMGAYAMLYASNAKEECGQLSGRNPKKRAKRLEERKERYAYGRFKGKDRKDHYGVYRVDK